MVLFLTLRNIGFEGFSVVSSERLLIFEQMHQLCIENTCIFMKL